MVLTTAQLDFDFDRPCETDRASVERLVAWLNAHPDWHLASDLLPMLGRPVNENSRRWLRRLAEKSDGKIISGQKGYRHTRHATMEENERFFAWMSHQIKTMANRLRVTRRYAHGRISGSHATA